MSASSGLGVVSSVDVEANSEQSCYICLQEGTDTKPLLTPCACKGRPVHRECLARWQLHSSGKSEEKKCRFCDREYDVDWQSTLLDSDELNEDTPKPLMAAVVFNNTVYKIPILPGPEGKAAFKRKVNELFGLSNRMFEVAFEVKLQEDKVNLRGLSAYEAATRCAAMSARRAASAIAADTAHDAPSAATATRAPIPGTDV
ncbi:hypothetical protein PLESTB_001379300 [Pleodorina starrii]|uniref:RING-CH-type domain-containing protein n=1 Tax=Pleodorina starrii TaxID=330485 RepID=A0A9W6F6Y0_9CHLO|nr:hypothetical protein PLESTM_000405900 [Pleodorina starrii]GLC58603.1 hypothetical protein PLESTB_001379300 [Pleodorina starrii]GLC67490.1 hypothetical protein PLESTF_000563100 [Pleodorina starrii]